MGACNSINENNRKKECSDIKELIKISNDLKTRSQKSESLYKQGLKIIKSQIEKGDNEKARIEAENTLKNKKHKIIYEYLSKKLSSIYQRLDDLQKKQKLTEDQKQLTYKMLSHKKSMNPILINQTINEFEKNLGNDNNKNNLFDGVNTANVPNDEVDQLINQVSKLNIRISLLS